MAIIVQNRDTVVSIKNLFLSPTLLWLLTDWRIEVSFQVPLYFGSLQIGILPDLVFTTFRHTPSGYNIVKVEVLQISGR